MSPSSGYLAAQAAVARGPLLFSGALSEGQFYSPPESFAGERELLCRELPSGRSCVGNQVGWACSFCSFSGSLGKASNPLPHSFSPHILALICEPHHLPLLLPTPVICSCFQQGLTMNQMRKSPGRKVSLPRYFCAHLYLGTGQCWALPGWTDSPAEARPRPECELVTVGVSALPLAGQAH